MTAAHRSPPGWDVHQWVADARRKMGLRVSWRLLNSSAAGSGGGASGRCATDHTRPACNAAVAAWNHGRWPGEGQERTFLTWLARHTSDSACWDAHDHARRRRQQLYSPRSVN